MQGGWRQRLIPALYRTHRLTGILATLIVVGLVITGILLNHTASLSLGSRHVWLTPLLDWYGIKEDPNPVWYSIRNDWIGQASDQLFLNENRLYQHPTPLVGVATTSDDYLVIAHRDQLVLLAPSGEIVEEIGIHQIISRDSSQPSPASVTILQLGSSKAGIHVITENAIFTSDDTLMSWQSVEMPDQAVQTRGTASPPEQMAARVKQLARGYALSWEQVLQDIHSGRILGTAGVILVDTGALLMLFLAISGACMWLNSHTARRKREQEKKFRKSPVSAVRSAVRNRERNDG